MIKGLKRISDDELDRVIYHTVDSGRVFPLEYDHLIDRDSSGGWTHYFRLFERDREFVADEETIWEKEEQNQFDTIAQNLFELRDSLRAHVKN